MFVSRWCYKSGPVKVIGQFSRNGVGCKIRVKFFSSHWSVVVTFNPSIVSQITSVHFGLFQTIYYVIIETNGNH